MSARPLLPTRIKLADYVRQHWRSTPDGGITLEQVMEPSFFGHIAKKIALLDIIEVIPQDNSYFAELLVTGKTEDRITVTLLRHVTLTHQTKSQTKRVQAQTNKPESAPPATERFSEEELEVKYRGAIAKHTVWVKDTRQVIREGFDTSDEAKDFLINYALGLVD